MSVAPSAPNARVLSDSAFVVDLKIDQPKILVAELLPFRLEAVPVDTDPQIMSIAPSAPNARILGGPASGIDFQINEAKILLAQLLPFGVKARPVNTSPKVIGIIAFPPNSCIEYAHVSSPLCKNDSR